MLATLVVVNHLWLPTSNRVGAHAVIAFYMISGFLMTKVINEVYRFTPRGMGFYVANRFLRIYPPYLIFLTFSLVLLMVAPSAASYCTILWPSSLWQWVQNITLIDFHNSKSAIIPPAWTLSVEFVFYLAMAAGLSRSRGIVAVWLAVSLAIHVYLLMTGASFAERYAPLYAASLFFSIGAAIYFWRTCIYNVSAGIALTSLSSLALMSLFCCWPLLIEWLGGDRLTLGYYGAVPIFLLIFIGNISNKPSRGVDRVLGDLAYPVFISHFMAAMLVNIFWPSLPKLGFGYLLVSYAVTLAASFAYLYGMHLPLEKLRQRIRNNCQRLC